MAKKKTEKTKAPERIYLDLDEMEIGREDLGRAYLTIELALEEVDVTEWTGRNIACYKLEKAGKTKRTVVIE